MEDHRILRRQASSGAPRRTRGLARPAMLLFSLLAVLGNASCATPVYWGDDIHATVVDAETGQPIEGAAVLAIWEISAIGEGFGESYVAHVGEAVTDSLGQFKIAGGGPWRRRIFTRFKACDPCVTILKIGYKVPTLPNCEPAENANERARYYGYNNCPESRSVRRVWQLNGERIPLRRVASAQEQAAELKHASPMGALEEGGDSVDMQSFLKTWSEIWLSLPLELKVHVSRPEPVMKLQGALKPVR